MEWKNFGENVLINSMNSFSRLLAVSLVSYSRVRCLYFDWDSACDGLALHSKMSVCSYNHHFFSLFRLFMILGLGHFFPLVKSGTDMCNNLWIPVYECVPSVLRGLGSMLCCQLSPHQTNSTCVQRLHHTATWKGDLQTNLPMHSQLPTCNTLLHAFPILSPPYFPVTVKKSH